MNRFLSVSLAVFLAASLFVPTTAWANGTPYYFDVDGTTAGFGSPSGTYLQNGAYWSTSSAGTDATVAFPAAGQLTFGDVGTDFAGATFTINMNSTYWKGLVVNSNSADITLIGTANAYSSYGGPYTWTVASGSTLTEAVTWTGNGLNFNNQEITLLGGGTINFNTALGRNSNAAVKQDGPTVNIQPVADYSTVVGTGGYVLNSGTLNFANALAFSNLNTRGTGKLTINGGTIDNTSGAAGTFTNNNGVIIGGDFTFTGSSDMSLGTGAVTLMASPTITVSAGNLTLEGVISGGYGLTKAGAGTLILTGDNTYTGPTTISEGTLTFSTPSFNTYRGGTITIEGAATMNVVTTGGYNRYDFQHATIEWDATGGGSLTLGSGINFVLDTASSGTTTFKTNGGAQNSIVGPGSINTGNAGHTVVFDVATGTGASGLLVSTGLGNGGAISKIGDGILTLNAASSYSGGTTISAGTLVAGNSSALGSGQVIMDGGTLNTSVNLSNAITLNDTTNTIAPNGNYRILSGQISGPGGFTVASGGGTPGLQLNNSSNDFQGDVTVNSGTYLRLTAVEVLPDAITVANNGNLRLDVSGGGTETIAGLTGTGSVWVPTSNSNLHTLRVGFNDTSSSFSGTIGAGGQNNAYLALVKIGDGTLTLNGNNPYGGTTTIDGGVLELHGGSSAYTYSGGNVYINNGSTLRISRGGNNQYWFNGKNFIFDSNGGGTIDTTSGLNFVVYGGSTVTTNGGAQNSIVGSSGINLHAGHTIYFDVADGTDAVDLDVAAPLWNGGGVNKTGDGVLRLSATNSYTGATTVNAGTLLVDGSIVSPVTVNGGTLGGVGSIARAVTINNTGTLAPGDSPGILTLTSGVTFTLGSTFEVELDGPTAGTEYDQLQVTGGLVNLGDELATLSVLLGNDPAVNSVFTIIDNQGTDAVQGTFVGLAEGTQFDVAYSGGTQPFVISYLGGDGNNVILTAVPEPSTLAMLAGLAGAALLGYLRRRRR